MSTPNPRGWWVVAGLFGVLMVSSGFGFYNLSVYVNVFASELDASTSAVSVLVSLFFITGGVAGIVVARMLDRVSVRLMMMSGALLSGITLGLCGAATELWMLWGLFILFGIGNAGVSIVVSTTLITQWFPGPNRSLALSIASTGLSVGGVIITPISAYALERLGTAPVMPWIGAAFFFMIAPLVWWLVAPAPKPSDTQASAERIQFDTRLTRSRFFVLHTLSYVLLMGVQVGGIAHLYTRAEEIAGFEVAATCVQILAVASIVARFIGGWLLMRLTAYRFTIANLALQTASIYIIATADSASGVMVGAAVFGTSVGNLLMLQPLQLAETYGPTVFARLFALANAITLIGVASGPLLLGLLHDAYDYDMAYTVGAALSFVALLVLLGAQAKPANSD